MVPTDGDQEFFIDKPGRGKYPRRRSEVPTEDAEDDPEDGDAEGGAGTGTATGGSRRATFYSPHENSYTPRDKEARVRYMTAIQLHFLASL